MNHNAKLTPAQITTARNAKAEGGRRWGAAHLAKLWGVSTDTVIRAASGEHYAGVPSTKRLGSIISPEGAPT